MTADLSKSNIASALQDNKDIFAEEFDYEIRYARKEIADLPIANYSNNIDINRVIGGINFSSMNLICEELRGKIIRDYKVESLLKVYNDKDVTKDNFQSLLEDKAKLLLVKKAFIEVAETSTNMSKLRFSGYAKQIDFIINKAETIVQEIKSAKEEYIDMTKALVVT